MSNKTPINFGGPSKHSGYCNAAEGIDATNLPTIFEASYPQFTI
jgi:hypothetical protein